LSLTAEEQKALRNLIKNANPTTGIYFRSVEHRFMDPSKVLDGRGTELYGGRFVPVGTKGVYLAESDAAASAEVLARKKRLGGASQISLDNYPRIVFAVDVKLQRTVTLTARFRNPTLVAITEKSLAENLGYSQRVGRFLADQGAQGLLFKSSVANSVNLLVFLENCTPSQLRIVQLDQTLDTMRQIAKAHPR